MQAKCGEFSRSLQKNWCTSGAIMFASPHFRRERFEPGCSDRPGSPGTCPTQAAAAAAPAICCLRTPSTLGMAWPKRNRTTWSLLPAVCLNSPYVFLKGTVSMIPNRNILLHFSILGEVIFISAELFWRHGWFSQVKRNPVITENQHWSLTWLCFSRE